MKAVDYITNRFAKIGSSLGKCTIMKTGNTGLQNHKGAGLAYLNRRFDLCNADGPIEPTKYSCSGSEINWMTTFKRQKAK